MPRLCPAMAAGDCFSGAACQELLFHDKDTTNGSTGGKRQRALLWGSGEAAGAQLRNMVAPSGSLTSW